MSNGTFQCKFSKSYWESRSADSGLLPYRTVRQDTAARFVMAYMLLEVQAHRSNSSTQIPVPCLFKS